MTDMQRPSMTCDDAALALMLGADSGDVQRARRHQDRCAECGLSPAGSDGLPVRLRAALPEPQRGLLGLVFVLGIVQALIAIPWMVGSDPLGLLGSTVEPSHATRDGAIGLAIALAAIIAAVRPRWARPGFFIAAALLGAQAVSGLVDSSIVDTGASEVVHLLSVVLTLLIAGCMVTQVLRPLGPGRRQPLRSVDDPD